MLRYDKWKCIFLPTIQELIPGLLNKDNLYKSATPPMLNSSAKDGLTKKIKCLYSTSSFINFLLFLFTL